MAHLSSEPVDHVGTLGNRVESGAALLACTADTVELLAGTDGVEWISHRQDVHLLAYPDVDKARLLVAELGLTAQTILDQVLLVGRPAYQAADLAQVHAQLFELVGGCYETLIDQERNRANIAGLFTVLDRHRSRPGAVLDFGCGTGLSLRVSSRPAELFGWDRSSQMRALAAAGGMDVIDVPTMADLPQGSFAGAVASYVFDLPTAPQAVGPLLSVVRPGGVLVANFHRDRNLSTVRGLAEDLGATVHFHGRDPRHGTVLAIEAAGR